MKKNAKLAVLALLIATLLTVPFQPAARGFAPSVTTLKIGLYYGGAALSAANLQNVTGFGEGYEFGYFDANRAFVPLGATTGTVKISMLRDRNMYYDASQNIYLPGTSGSIVVGCYHIRLGAYTTCYEASVAAAGIADAFVKYDSGSFYVCVGNYTTADEANAAASSRGLSGSITSGTAYTVAVVETGTNRMLFEFDDGTGRSLAVTPLTGANGAKPQTWFKGYRYYGAFEYTRVGGEDLTVFNFVNIEDYTKGVLPYEMANDWPLEALKAQAVCARTYAASKIGAHSASGFDLCTTEHCQVYRGMGSANDLTNRAVDETAGLYVTYDGKLCETYFSSCDGGATENVENVWSAALPYLRGVVDPYEADVAPSLSYYSWT
ncbi:MAG: SpoIID/LytB domain-containing protein, partial [Oscillospiraceae bacterium]|nr:SpoIID/LytB domain-containing protein [Oscillospiraceae bacterium]